MSDCGASGASLECVLCFSEGFVCSKTTHAVSQSVIREGSWEGNGLQKCSPGAT